MHLQGLLSMAGVAQVVSRAVIATGEAVAVIGICRVVSDEGLEDGASLPLKIQGFGNSTGVVTAPCQILIAQGQFLLVFGDIGLVVGDPLTDLARLLMGGG